MSEIHRVLTELENKGELKTLVKGGVCAPTVFRNIEVYRFVDSRMKTGSKKTPAVLEAEVQFKLCRKTIFNILKGF